MAGLPRKKLKKLVAGLLGFLIIASGFFYINKKKMLSGKFITGLYFHNPSTKNFNYCIGWLKKNSCIFISSDQLVNILAGKSKIPPRAVWVTLDDGWRENMKNVIPTITQENIPITFFVSTGPVEGDGIFWFNLARSHRHLLPTRYQKNIHQLWGLDQSKRKVVLDQLKKRITQPIPRNAMTLPELKSISKLPQVTIGDHTVNHPPLINCTFEELYFEIISSQEKLEKWTNNKIKFFAYPFGKYEHREKEFLAKTSFHLAVTCKKNFISTDSDVYALPRFNVNDDAFCTEILCQMVGAWGRIMEIFKL